MADLAKLVVSLEAQTAKYQRELEKANKKLSRFERTQRGAINSISSGFKKLAGAFAALQFGRLIRDSINTADAYAKLQRRLGITTEAISELTYVAELAGVSQQQLALGLQRMTRRIAEASKGMGEAQSALRELGLDARKLTKLPLDKQFEVIADQLSKVEGESDKVRLAFKLFDSEGVGLVQLMGDGAAGIRNMREEARGLGVTLRSDQAAAAEEAKNAMFRLRAEFDGFARDLTLDVVPALDGVIEKLRSVYAEAKIGIEGLRNLINRATGEEQGDRASEAFDRYAEAKRQLDELQGILPRNRTPKISQAIAAKQEEVNELYARWQQITQELADNHREIVESNIENAAIVAEAEPDLVPPVLDTELLPELTIESNLDRILRPEVSEDIENASRATEEWFENMIKTAREAEKVKSIGEELGLTFASAAEDAIVNFESLRDVMQGLLQDIIRVLARMWITTPVTDFFGGLFGGPKAAGGPVKSGTTYLVGERGPELFTPSSSGRIVPNHQLGGSVTYQVSVDARADRQQILAELIPLLDRTVETTVGIVQGKMREGRLA